MGFYIYHWIKQYVKVYRNPTIERIHKMEHQKVRSAFNRGPSDRRSMQPAMNEDFVSQQQQQQQAMAIQQQTPRQSISGALHTQIGIQEDPFAHIQHVDGGTIDDVKDMLGTGARINTSFTHLCVRDFTVDFSNEHPVFRVGDHDDVVSTFKCLEAFSQDTGVIKEKRTDDVQGDLTNVQVFSVLVGAQFNEAQMYGVNVGFRGPEIDDDIEFTPGQSHYSRMSDGSLMRHSYSLITNSNKESDPVQVIYPPNADHYVGIKLTPESLMKDVYQIGQYYQMKMENDLTKLLVANHHRLDLADDSLVQVEKRGEIFIEAPVAVVDQLVMEFQNESNSVSTIRDLNDLTIEVMANGGRSNTWSGMIQVKVLFAYL